MPSSASPRLVSIIVNCYNGEAFLDNALRSILHQSYPHWELIFWDNKSTDSSKSIFLSYHDSRFNYYYSDTHTRLYEARLSALNFCTGDYICFLDVDDWWEPDKLLVQLSSFTNDNISLVASNYTKYYEQSSVSKPAFSNDFPEYPSTLDLLNEYNIGLLTIMVKKSSLLALSPPFDSNFHIIGDFDFVIRLSLSSQIRVLRKKLAYCRYHSRNESFDYAQTLIEFHTWLSKSSSYPKLKPLLSSSSIFNRVNYIQGLVYLRYPPSVFFSHLFGSGFSIYQIFKLLFKYIVASVGSK